MKRLLPHIFPLIIIIGLVFSFILNIQKYESSKPAADVNISKTNTVSCSPSTQEQKNDDDRLPILMYHEIGDGPNGLYVTVNDFRTQMHYLRDNGFHTVTMKQAEAMLADHEVEPKTAAITFDDGYLSFYTEAWPILQECGFTATVYVCSSFVGRRMYLSWDQLKELQAGGIEIGSHTQTHPSLKTAGYDKASAEIQVSKQIIEQNLGLPVLSFCYPSGAYNENTLQIIKDAGYTSAVTVAFGYATPQDNRYLLPRIRIPGGKDMDYFQKYIH